MFSKRVDLEKNQQTTKKHEKISQGAKSLGSDKNFDNVVYCKFLMALIFYICRRKFVKKPPNTSTPRSFVEFILEPMYKIFSQVIFFFFLHMIMTTGSCDLDF